VLGDYNATGSGHLDEESHLAEWSTRADCSARMTRHPDRTQPFDPSKTRFRLVEGWPTYAQNLAVAKPALLNAAPAAR
jgi:hypothetical protein